MRDLLRGYATAILESAATAGHARQVASDLGVFSRALHESDPLRNVLTDAAIAPRARRGVVHDLLEGKAAAESQALACWAALVEPAAELPVAVLALVELALETADASEAGQVRPISAEELLGGRTAVRERIRGYADRLFQEVDRLEQASRTNWSVLRGSSTRTVLCARCSPTRQLRSRNGSLWPRTCFEARCFLRLHDLSPTC